MGRRSSPLKHNCHVWFVLVCDYPPTVTWLQPSLVPVNTHVLRCCCSKLLPSHILGVTVLTSITSEVPPIFHFSLRFWLFCDVSLSTWLRFRSDWLYFNTEEHHLLFCTSGQGVALSPGLQKQQGGEIKLGLLHSSELLCRADMCLCPLYLWLEELHGAQSCSLLHVGISAALKVFCVHLASELLVLYGWLRS